MCPKCSKVVDDADPEVLRRVIVRTALKNVGGRETEKSVEVRLLQCNCTDGFEVIGTVGPSAVRPPESDEDGSLDDECLSSCELAEVSQTGSDDSIPIIDLSDEIRTDTDPPCSESPPTEKAQSHRDRLTRTWRALIPPRNPFKDVDPVADTQPNGTPAVKRRRPHPKDKQ